MSIEVLVHSAWWLRLSYRKRGWGYQSGVLVCHAGGKSGRLLALEWAIKRAHSIVCCYPAAVKRENPSLPIVGDWEGLTQVLYLGWHLLVYEEG